MHGIYPILKPTGPTSHDIIYQVRKITGEQRVGHAGTLDPLASGVLVVAVGREYTKQLDTHVQAEKEYLATVTLGATTTTDDAQGEVTPHPSPIVPPTAAEISTAVQSYIGTIQQIPPIYSAIKVAGKPAHRRVRSGQTISLPARTVTIHDIAIVEYSYPRLVLKVHTGKGVYIRSLARDIGAQLRTGGYLSELIRTRVGQYRIEDALTLEQLRHGIDQTDRLSAR